MEQSIKPMRLLHTGLVIRRNDEPETGKWRKMEPVRESVKRSAMDEEIRRLNQLVSKPPFCFIYKGKENNLR